jgi:CRP-like cAMP-binding protein
MNSCNELKEHINRFVRLSDDEFEQILGYVKPVSARKKQNLHESEKVCKSNFFVRKGCLRLFFINDKGVEQTIQFALENWWLSDYTSFSSQQTSLFYIQAVEKSEVVAINFPAQEKMLQQFPQMERYFRLIHQRAHAASQYRLKGLFSQTREKIYHDFCKQYPAFVQRIPQYLLASFLGFTPEYLSEIRGKRIS